MMEAPGPAVGDGKGAHDRAVEQGLHTNLKQFVKFSLVGGSGVLVNLVVFAAAVLLWLLVSGSIGSATDLRHYSSELVVKKTGDIARAAGYAANASGFVVSVLTNYCLNRRWTFRSDNPVAGELSRFAAVSVVAYCGNLAVFWACHARLDVSLLLSQMIAIAAVMPVNFALNKIWSFR